MTDRATQAAERIAKCLYAELDSFVIDSEQIDEWAAIIRGVYIAETAMQHRAEHLERVLAKVREECEEICHCLAAGEVQIPPEEEFIPSCRQFWKQTADRAGVLTNCLTMAQLIAENELLREQNARLSLTWTREAPTCEGWFWTRYIPESWRGHEYAVLVHVLWFRSNEFFGTSPDHPVTGACWSSHEWAGPIPLPQEPTPQVKP